LLDGVESASNVIDSTSLAEKFNCLEPTATMNLPPPKLTILPLIMLPSFSRIVSAKVIAEIENTRHAAPMTRKKLDLNDIISSVEF
jgi:hypothetical protein